MHFVIMHLYRLSGHDGMHVDCASAVLQPLQGLIEVELAVLPLPSQGIFVSANLHHSRHKRPYARLSIHCPPGHTSHTAAAADFNRNAGPEALTKSQQDHHQ